MNSTLLYRLQTRQREHDERFHADIYGGNVKHRVAHYAHHYAKYAGKIAALVKHKPDEPAFSKNLERVITDAFIITLAASDALNIDFEAANGAAPQEPRPAPHAVAENLLYDFTIYQGGFAKAMDAHDHLESFAIGEELRQSTKDIMRTLLAAADNLALKLEAATFQRWKEVEAKRIL